ncbi:MAG: aldehyde dehydrogenase family protein [Sphingomicrobium sp.]
MTFHPRSSGSSLTAIRARRCRHAIRRPIAAIQVARDLDHAIHLHNATDYGLVGAIFTADSASETRFLAEAQAGMLSINRARPAFSPAGPFVGWKSSGFGPPEDGRWNRDTYTRPQAHYRPD